MKFVSCILLFSLIYTYTLTEFAKNWVHRERPDGSDDKSFFSGHSSTTFTAASFLYREANDFFDTWKGTSNNTTLRTSLKIASFTALYGWAGYVAYSRMRDNKHYVSDVVVGAAVGTLIGNLVYNGYFSNELSVLNNVSLCIVNDVPTVSLIVGAKHLSSP
jgi:membrane-associated phospholipid phosphatase